MIFRKSKILLQIISTYIFRSTKNNYWIIRKPYALVIEINKNVKLLVFLETMIILQKCYFFSNNDRKIQ